MELIPIQAPVQPRQPTLVWSPHALQSSRDRDLVWAEFLPGESIGQYLDRIGILQRIGRRPFGLTLNGYRIPRALWWKTVPKPGAMLNLYAVLRGGDGKNPLATIAMIAVMVVAPYVAPALGIAAAGTMGASIVAAGFTVLGGLAVNALFPPPKPRQPNSPNSESPTYALTGGSNQMRRYQPMPKICGRHIIFPDLGAQPYTEFEGEEQILFQAFDLGYNEVELSEYRIGQTEIANFTGVILEESGTDGKIGSFPGNVDTVTGAELTSAIGWIQRTSSPNTTCLAVEVTGILFRVTDEGDFQSQGVIIRIQYRHVGDSTWIDIVPQSDTDPVIGNPNQPNKGGWLGMVFQAGRDFVAGGVLGAGELRVINGSRKPVRRTYRWFVPEGQYEVRVMRVTPDFTDKQTTGDLVFTQLRSYQPDTADYSERKRLGLRIRASGQLNGAVDQFNCIARARTEVYAPLNSISKSWESNLWQVGTTFPSGYTPNRSVADESFFAVREGPFGTDEVVNVCQSLDTPPGDPGMDGGWQTNNVIPYDRTKSHLFACFFKRLSTGTITGANSYWGLHTNATGDTLNLNGTTNSNPYFISSAPGTFMPLADKWYLAVGFVHEQGYGSTDTLISGVYDPDTGAKVLSGTEFKFVSGSGTLLGHRAYHYYNQTISGEVQQHARPIVVPCTVAGASALIAEILADRRKYLEPDWSVRETSNPAWWYLDIARGKFLNGIRLYGAGLPDTKIDIEGLKLFADWCTEQDIEFNAVFDEQQTVWEMLSAIALMGRATPSWATGKLGVVWDAPDLAHTAVFGMHNIIMGSFEVEYATENLADVIEGWFTNPETNWQRDYVRVNVPGAEETLRVHRLELFGCIDRGEAAEHTNLYAATNAFRTRKYKWQSDWEAMPCSRGDVVILSHDMASFDYSGRFIEGGSNASLKLPRKVPLYEAGAFIIITKPTGESATYPVNGGTGEVDTLVPTTPLPFNPWADGDHPPYDYRWTYGPTATPGKKVKIERFRPVSQKVVEIIAIDERPEYYLAKTNPYAYTPPKPIFGAIPTVTSISISYDGVRTGNGYAAQVNIDWAVTGTYSFVDVRYAIGDGPMLILETATRKTSTTVLISDRQDITVEVKAYSDIGRLGGQHTLTTTEFVDFAGSRVPSDVVEFSISGNRFTWSEAPEVDVIGYQIRFHLGNKVAWESASPLHLGIITEHDWDAPALPTDEISVTFLIKAIDAAYQESDNAAAIYKDIGDPAVANVLEVYDERDTGWPGTITGGSVVSGDLEANTSTLFYGPDDSAPIYTTDTDPMYPATVYAELIYETGYVIPTSALFGSVISAQHVLSGEITYFEWRRDGTGAFYTADGDPLYTGDGDLLYTPIGDYIPWTGSRVVEPGDIYQFRARAIQSGIQGIFEELIITIDAPDLEEEMNNIVISPSGTRLPITKNYTSIKSVQATLEDDGGTAVTFEIVDRDPDLGPLIRALDAAKVATSGRGDFRIKGY